MIERIKILPVKPGNGIGDGTERWLAWMNDQEDGEDAGKKVTATSTIFKRDDEKRLVWGWGSVIKEGGKVLVDRQNDVIDEEDLVKAAHDFMSSSRVGKVMHQGKAVGEVVESMVFTEELQKALGVDVGKVGWLVCMKVHDDAMWDLVKSGFLKAFSIGGVGVREPYEEK